MTLTRFVTKNAFRNKRRTVLTVLSIGVSLLLLTFMMTVWRSFYIDQGTVQGIFTAPTPTQTIYFNKTYLDEGYAQVKGSEGVFAVLVDTPEDVPRVAKAIDEEFRNAPRPTKSESERAFQLGFIQMLGNVKAFILSICLAVVFAILLVSANTMAMSIRERTREVALLKTLGFTRRKILGLFVGEAVSLAVLGGVLGTLAAFVLVGGMARQGGFLTGMRVTPPTMLVALLVAALVGFASEFLPSYHASRVNIVDGLRHIG